MNSLNDILSDRSDDLGIYSMPSSDDKITDAPDETVTKEPELNISQMKNMVHQMKDQLDGMLRLLNNEQVDVRNISSANSDVQHLETGEQIIEGVFNGVMMVGSDGKEYAIPPNYASKSKLVEGDMMKLTITNQGSFIYKQIAPIERKRIVGELVSDPSTAQWSVLALGKTYKVLTASVTFYKGKAGDETVILVPQSGDSAWGAVENIINK
ncbi:hypothetical protein KJ641_03060 [Patescibacteria group bacterium]|nr:hypothetical protein [Patescibacteria group bacterium]MBU1895822.1 hypothetical protein [Patescibacteria group bacterium]